jgi:hypothetical protein
MTQFVLLHDAGVALEDRQLYSLHGAAAKLLAVVIRLPGKYFVDVQRSGGKARREDWIDRQRRPRIPRADVLADVTAVEPIVEFSAQLG